MVGKILGLGAIRGDDGKRYGFEINDIKNLNGRSIDNVCGLGVDFEISENMAKDIYIVGGENIPMEQNKETMKPHIPKEVSKIRDMYMLSCSIAIVFTIIFYMLPDDNMEIVKFILFAMFLFACILSFVATFKLHKASESKTLLRNSILYILSCFGTTIAILLLSLVLIPEVRQIIADNFTVIIGVISFPFQILLARELSFIMGQKIILWSNYLCLPLYLIPNEHIALLFEIVVILTYIIGVYRFKEIRKRTSEDYMPWI